MSARTLDWIASILLIIGGLNLGIVGLFNYDPLIGLLSESQLIAHSLFFLIGMAAIYGIYRIWMTIRTLHI